MTQDCATKSVEMYQTVGNAEIKEKWYLGICSVGAICSLHCHVVEGALFSIKRFGNDDGAHSLRYIKHTVTVPTCTTAQMSSKKGWPKNAAHTYFECTRVMMNM